MKRSLLVVGSAIVLNVVLGQCTVTVSNVQVFPTTTCFDQFGSPTMTPGIYGVIGGGTPPYSVGIGLNGTVWATYSKPTGGVANWALDYGCPNQCNTHNTGQISPYMRVTDAMGCVAEGFGSWYYYYFDRLMHTPGALNTNTFNVQVEPVNCAAGTFLMRLVDNPLDAGDAVFTLDINYSLSRNGTIVESGSLASKYVGNPASCVFNGMTPGIYTLSLNAAYADPHMRYCPDDCIVRFVVPNAGDCGTNVSVQAQLTTMTDALRAANLLPTTEPYTAMGYTYVGTAPGATVGAGVFNVTGNDAVVDWVIVEARTTITPSAVVASAPALLQVDGDVVGLTGKPYVTLPIAAGNYKVVVRHRNHLALMTGLAHPLGVFCGIDLRHTNVSTASGAHSLFVGDVTGDGAVKYTGLNNDRDPILIRVGNTTPNNTVSNVYDRHDVNLDGQVKYTGANNDRDPILSLIGSPTNTYQQLVP